MTIPTIIAIMNNVTNLSNEENSMVDSIINDLNQENNNEKKLGIFENLNSNKETEVKEPEMFEEPDLEEDFEIPAFLRRQKN